MVGRPLLPASTRRRRRLVAGTAFVLLTAAASILVARKLTHASWPLDNAQPLLVAAAASAYLVSFLFRARGWHRLFPPGDCPGQAGCLASVGAAAAGGAVLPFRLDYLIKIGTLRRLGGVRIGFEAIVLSIISLGMIDAIAMLPLSISATALSTSRRPEASEKLIAMFLPTPSARRMPAAAPALTTTPPDVIGITLAAAPRQITERAVVGEKESPSAARSAALPNARVDQQAKR